MALSTTVSQRKLIKRKAPRGFLKRVFKQRKPHLRLETNSDLLKRLGQMLVRISVESLKRSMYWLQQR
ncbi:centromere protein W isoform X2 [Balaenoptera ricei]|uniref:Centromere protein W isoform X2 n=2 Tax=Balaenoptera TaxID=9766 RepID=A0A8B8YYN1_BALMU|nr:centromere protein W isoform X2 [Balaenoptera acutorostrata]XP_036727607.1 centromere protein W isoform X2 [Balaenoptera musculus]XP_059797936.1 centromere protein W isoform X2 [Balaenoptera ricei]XP_061063482.1 centromere protein W isoform X3 [Eubalaena glacialis]